MLFSLLLVGLFTLSLATQGPRQFQFENGQTLVYEYETRLLSGIPELAEQYAGVDLKANLVIQPSQQGWVGMQLNNVKLGQLNGQVQDENIDLVHHYDKVFFHELVKPVWFNHQNGKVVSFRTHSTDPTWSVNIKKAILSLFNVNLTPQQVMQSENGRIVAKPVSLKDLTYYGVYERSVAGICETVYEIKQMPDAHEAVPEKEFVLNVTKTRNFDNCLTQPSFVNDNYDVRGCLQFCRSKKQNPSLRGYYPVPDELNDVYMSGCPCDQRPTKQAIDQFQFVRYNISTVGQQLTIEGIYSEGKVKLMEMMIITQQNVTLFAQRQINEKLVMELNAGESVDHQELDFRTPIRDWQDATGELHLPDTPYLHIFGEPNFQEWTENVPRLVERIADDLIAGDVQSTEKTTVQVKKLANTLAALPYKILRQLFEQIATKGVQTDAEVKDQMQRQIFLDVLAHAATRSVAKLIKELTETDRLTVQEAQRMIEIIPNNMFLPGLETLEQYLDFCQSPKIMNEQDLFSAVCITFGKMVHKACVKSDYQPGDIPNQQQYPIDKRHPQARMIVNQVDPRQQQQDVVEVEEIARSKRDTLKQTFRYPFPQQVCQPQHVEKYVNVISLLLRRANTYHSKTVYMKTLEQINHWRVLPILERWASGRVSQSECPGYPVEDVSLLAEECIFMRHSALRSLEILAPSHPQKILAISLPIYRDTSEPYQIRLQAFTNVILSAPGKQVLESIASDLRTENNKQVRGYVATTFNILANTSLPCYYKLSENARSVIDLLPEVQVGHQTSRVYYQDDYSWEDKFGYGILSRLVANNISYIPRDWTYIVNTKTGLFTNTLFKLAAHQKGIEHVIERLSEPNGIITDTFESLFGKRQEKMNEEIKHKDRPKRNTNSVQEALESLKKRLGFKHRTDDLPKMEIVSQLLHQTKLWALDEKQINKLIDEVEETLQVWTQRLVDGYTGHFVRIFFVSHYTKVLPSPIGLPIYVNQYMPLILSLKVDNAKLDLGEHPKTLLPVGFNLTASVNLQLITGNVYDMAGINVGTSNVHGVAHKTQIRIAVPFEFSIGYYRPKNLLTVSWIPQLPTEWLHYTSEPFTYQTKTLVSAAPDEDVYKHRKPIRSIEAPLKVRGNLGQKWLGIGWRYQINSENPWILPIKQDESVMMNIVRNIFKPDWTPMEAHVTLEVDDKYPTYGFDFTMKYKWIADEENVSDKDDSDESSASSESDSDESDESSSSVSSSSREQRKQIVKRSIRSNEIKHGKKLSKMNVHDLKIHKLQRKQYQQQQQQQQQYRYEQQPQFFSTEQDQQDYREYAEKHQRQQQQYRTQTRRYNLQSSESDTSASFENGVFDYEDVLSLILGQSVDEHNLRKITRKLIKKTQDSWLWSYDDDSDDSSSDESHQEEKDLVPATMTHDFAFTALLRGPNPTFLAANLAFVHTFDHRTNWVKFDSHIKTPVGEYVRMPHLFCVDSVIAYPRVPSEFYFDQTTMQDQKAKIKTEIGWGEQCRSEGGLIVTGVLEKVQDQVFQTRDFVVQRGVNVNEAKEWFYHQCEVDRAEGKPLSYACSRAILQSSYFNRLVLDVTYKNVPKYFVNATHKFDMWLKHYLYNNMQNNAVDYQGPRNQIRIVADYSGRIPGFKVANVLIQKPTEQTSFKRVHVPYFRPPSSLYRYRDVLMNVYSSYEQTARHCVLMENTVRTFDNVTFKMPETQCQYLVAMDCSTQEQFSVFAKNLDSQANTKKVTVYVNGQQIVLLPPQQQKVTQVEIDGKTEEFTPLTPRVFCHADNCMRIWLQAIESSIVNDVLVIEVPHKGVTIKYDGKNVKVLTNDRRFRGKLCGICGNNDGETEEEFVGPNQCVYDEEEDFVHSYSMVGEHCQKISKPVGQVRCPNHMKQIRNILKKKTSINTKQTQAGVKTVIRQSYQEQTGPNTQEPACQQYRNIVTEGVQGQICFSIKPVLQCGECGVRSTQVQQVQFHCLPKNSPFAQKLQTEVKVQELKALANKKIDHQLRVNVPQTCGQPMTNTQVIDQPTY